MMVKKKRTFRARIFNLFAYYTMCLVGHWGGGEVDRWMDGGQTNDTGCHYISHLVKHYR